MQTKIHENLFHETYIELPAFPKDCAMFNLHNLNTLSVEFVSFF